MAKTSSQSSVPITLLKRKDWNHWIKKQPASVAVWAEASRFVAEPASHCVIADKTGATARVLAGISDKPNLWSLAALPIQLPASTYHLETPVDAKTAEALMLGWLLGSYQFGRYKKFTRKLPLLQPPKGANVARVNLMAEAINHARDLINTPANDMGPGELAAACKRIAAKYQAQYKDIIGEDLVRQNYPAIYAVGKASSREPRLIDIRWGNKKHPKVTLVGKGVCFDSGGLDIKTSAGMKLMKKDMAGAACVLALAEMIMAEELPVRLRVLIPAVENSISANAYRPSDIIATRKGLTVEVGNTDAEGRLILCDALYEADEEEPDLLIDCATLTGAARTALGTDIPALFTPDDVLAENFMQHSADQSDPLWRLPLWQGYRDMLNTPVADLNSAPDGGYAGAITAALYLKEFVTKTNNWAHIDMMAWNLASRPGRPIGGEAMAIRAAFALIKEKYS